MGSMPASTRRGGVRSVAMLPRGGGRGRGAGQRVGGRRRSSRFPASSQLVWFIHHTTPSLIELRLWVVAIRPLLSNARFRRTTFWRVGDVATGCCCTSVRGRHRLQRDFV